MKEAVKHPENLDLYLDRETGEPGYEEIRQHLETCSECSQRVEDWRSFGEMFRQGEEEIDISPFQWQRIEANLRAAEAVPKRGWFASMYPQRAAWKMAFASLALVVTVIAGYEYRANETDRQLLAAARQAAEQGPEFAMEENPFRIASFKTRNPFSRDYIPESIKTSADGR